MMYMDDLGKKTLVTQLDRLAGIDAARGEGLIRQTLWEKIVYTLGEETLSSILNTREYADLRAAHQSMCEACDRCVGGRIAGSEYEYLRLLIYIRYQMLYHRVLLHEPQWIPTADTGESWYQHFLLVHRTHHIALLDHIDHQLFGSYKLSYRRGYACLGSGPLHRKILERMLPNAVRRGLMADHIDGNHFDCRRFNLRLATPAQNSWNRFRPKTNKTGYKGVSLYRDGMYNVEICTNGKREYIGRWSDKRDAAIAYDIVCKDRCGVFAKPNGIAYTLAEERRIRADVAAKQPKPPKTAPYYGVSRHFSGWRSDFRYHGTRYQVGTYRTPEEAARAVDNQLEILGRERRNGTMADTDLFSSI